MSELVKHRCNLTPKASKDVASNIFYTLPQTRYICSCQSRLCLNRYDRMWHENDNAVWRTATSFQKNTLYIKSIHIPRLVNVRTSNFSQFYCVPYFGDHLTPLSFSCHNLPYRFSQVLHYSATSNKN